MKGPNYSVGGMAFFLRREGVDQHTGNEAAQRHNQRNEPQAVAADNLVGRSPFIWQTGNTVSGNSFQKNVFIRSNLPEEPKPAAIDSGARPGKP